MYEHKPFPGQRPDEVVVFGFRQHPMVLINTYLVALVVAAFSVYLGRFVDPAWVIILPGLLVGSIIALRRYLIWFLSVTIISDQRLVSFKFQGLFNKVVSEVLYPNIALVNYRIRGPLMMAMAIGELEIKTFKDPIMIKYVHHPERVHQRLSQVVSDVAHSNETPVV